MYNSERRCLPCMFLPRLPLRLFAGVGHQCLRPVYGDWAEASVPKVAAQFTRNEPGDAGDERLIVANRPSVDWCGYWQRATN